MADDYTPTPEEARAAMELPPLSVEEAMMCAASWLAMTTVYSREQADQRVARMIAAVEAKARAEQRETDAQIADRNTPEIREHEIATAIRKGSS